MATLAWPKTEIHSKLQQVRLYYLLLQQQRHLHAIYYLQDGALCFKSRCIVQVAKHLKEDWLLRILFLSV